MNQTRDALAAILDWLPPPLRLGLLSLITLGVLLRLVPALLRVVGAAIARSVVPIAEMLTYPEYLATSLSRSLGWRLLPGSHLYGRVLGAFATGGVSVGTSLLSLGQRRPGLPWKTLLIVVGLMTATWFTKTESVPPSLRPSTATLRDDIARLDGWLATGTWRPISTSCPPPAEKPKPQTPTSK